MIYNDLFSILTYKWFGPIFHSIESEEVFSKTDSALEKLQPWPENIPLQVFQSEIRFSIRLDDLRQDALSPNKDVTIDEVMEFFNPVIGELLNRYTQEIEDTSQRKKTWKYEILLIVLQIAKKSYMYHFII